MQSPEADDTQPEGVADASSPTPGTSRPGKPGEVLEELRDLLLAYFRQEAVEPLKRLLAWLGWGMLGAALLCIGMVLLALAALRALQTETAEHLSGSLSWTPYAIVLAAFVLIFAFALKSARARRRRSDEAK